LWGHNTNQVPTAKLSAAIQITVKHVKTAFVLEELGLGGDI
jgi:hypothetical protein